MAFVLSSISGNLISAASAGFAPTNSADVSAIASSYQVVSATGTKLYNGTYYLTSVNDNQLSAKYAVSASSATAAFYARYDRQGGVVRYLSSLPGSAEVSAIASAYAESAVSGKQDELTFSYDDDKISAINGSALAGQGGGGGEADWSAESGQPGYIENKPVPKTLVAGQGITITENSTGLVVASTNTLYTAGSGLMLNGTTFSVDPTAVQGKLTYDYDASGNISGIDGSALVGGDPEATDLYVQSPLYTGVSGGSAYIGWNNETVLYSDFSGRPTETGGTISLNESPLNFQYVEVYLNGTNATSTAAGWSNAYQKIDTVTLSSVPGLTFVGLLSGNSTWWDVGCAYAGVSSTTWTKVLGYTKQVDSNAAGQMSNVPHLNIWKVVGLNRTAGE